MRFDLTIIDDTHMILSTEDVISAQAHAQVQTAFATWLERGGTAVIGECKVRDERYASIELDLPSPAEVRHEALVEGSRLGLQEGAERDADKGESRRDWLRRIQDDPALPVPPLPSKLDR